MPFFKQFPKIDYSIKNDAILTEVTDYFRYVDVIDRLAKNTYAYQKIDILNGERPDNLSHRLYGTPDYYWTFFITNDFLKDGISAWPKSDNELSNFTTTSYKNLAAFRFPLQVRDGDRLTPLGLPINQSKNLPYLWLCTNLSSFELNGELVEVGAKIKIKAYEPNLSLIWVDKNTATWFSHTESVNDEVGDGGANDKIYSGLVDRTLFHPNATQDFTVQFFNDGTASSENVDWHDNILSLVDNLRKDSIVEFANFSKSEVDRKYNLRNTQYWKDGKTAPAYYYSGANVEEVTSEYLSGDESTAYVSREAEIIEENDEHRSIQYVAPAYIQSFAREYKRLLNE